MDAQHRLTIVTYGHPSNNVVELVVQDREGNPVARATADRRDLGALIADRTEEFVVGLSRWDSVEVRGEG